MKAASCLLTAPLYVAALRNHPSQWHSVSQALHHCVEEAGATIVLHRQGHIHAPVLFFCPREMGVCLEVRQRLEGTVFAAAIVRALRQA